MLFPQLFGKIVYKKLFFSFKIHRGRIKLNEIPHLIKNDG